MHRQKCPQSKHADTVAVAILQDNAQSMGRDAQIAGKLATSEQYAEAGEPNT